MTAAKLYSRELLAAAVELAAYPPIDDAPRHAAARAPTCGSTLALDLVTDAQGRIARIGLAVRACAVGQAAAAVFARHAPGRDAEEIERALAQLEDWLAHGGDAPDWPDLALIAPARVFRARHGAMLLPWKAANTALSSAPAAG